MLRLALHLTSGLKTEGAGLGIVQGRILHITEMPVTNNEAKAQRSLNLRSSNFLCLGATYPENIHGSNHRREVSSVEYTTLCANCVKTGALLFVGANRTVVELWANSYHVWRYTKELLG